MNRKTDVQQGTLDLMILKTLQMMGSLHGYGIARRIEQTSGDLLSVNYGTIYPALLKLEQEGSISAEWGVRSPDFFSTLGISLIRGRFFTTQDNRPDTAKVVLISRTLASKYFPGENPIGRQMKFEEDDQKNAWTVVGVVADTRFFAWDHDTGVVTYVPYRALGGRAHFGLALQTAGTPSDMTGAAKNAVWAVDRDLPLLETATMQQRMNRAFAPWRFNAIVLGAFGVAALFLSSLGIFGLLSYLVVQRTKEIGLRMALGAMRFNILRFVINRALILTLIGIGCGLPCSLCAGLRLRGLLYGAEPIHAAAFVLAALTLLNTGIVSAFLPGRTACSVDPMLALRVT
jgi:ABC-type antimicrobial peptide transport system permease subunit